MQARAPKEPAPLPTRPPRHAVSRSAAAMVVQSPYDADAMKRTLQDVRGTVDRITGLLVATRDGLVVCADTNGVENDAVAAMSAAASGLANQFTSQAKVGEPRASMFEGESGFVGVFPIEAPLLLVVFGERDTTMGLFNVAARQALSLVQQAIVRQRVQGVRRTRREFFEDDAEASGE